jgi:hypothetical protein
VSADGKTWQQVGQTSIHFEGAVKAGLCLSGHNTQERADAAFDQVLVE